MNMVIALATVVLEMTQYQDKQQNNGTNNLGCTSSLVAFFMQIIIVPRHIFRTSFLDQRFQERGEPCTQNF